MDQLLTSDRWTFTNTALTDTFLSQRKKKAINCLPPQNTTSWLFLVYTDGEELQDGETSNTTSTKKKKKKKKKSAGAKTTEGEGQSN